MKVPFLSALCQLALCFLLCFGIVFQADAQAEFIKNEGQWDTDYQYLAKLQHGDFWVGAQKVSFVLSDFGLPKQAHPHGNPDNARLHNYTMEFLGASSSATVSGHDKMKRYHNYYTSSNQRKWRSGVGLFGSVVQEDIYPGTNLLWKESEGNLKYEFTLQAGANPENIRIRYNGLDDLKMVEGNLVLETSLGTISEQKPIAWQLDRLGRKIQVRCRFKLLDDHTTGFEFPSGYDNNKPLVIDPILVFSTFSGSRSDNWGFTSTYGEESCSYAAGIALGPHFPTTPGAFSATFAGDSVGINIYATYDIGILKFNPSGTELLYSTYIGGAEAEAPASLVVDKDSNLVLLGTTSSQGYPVTANAFDTSYNGGILASPYGPGESVVQFRRGSDIVVSKFSKDGRVLKGSTFLGGSANDGLLTLLELGNSPLVKNYGDSFRGEVIADSSGRILVASHTLSLDFPTASPIQSQLGGGSDAIFAVFSPGLDSLKFSTYHGGSLDDAAYSVQFGEGNQVYLAGGTASNDFPVTPGTLKPFFSGVVDGFVTRFSLGAAASTMRSTYLGTSRYDQAYFVQRDKSGNVYAYGQTIGAYPVTAGVYKNPGSAQFIHCLSADLDSTRFSTVFGSGTPIPNISPTAFLVDDCGRIYCSGWGGGTNNFSGYENGNTIGLPTTPASGNQTTDGSDFYILVLEKNASSIVFGTYFGDSQSLGDHVDGGTSRFDKRGVIYQSVCAGCGGFSSFPTTPGVVSNFNASTNCNNAIFVYDFSKLQARYNTTSSGGCVPLTLSFKSISVYDNQIKWDFDDGPPVFGNSTDSISHTFVNPGVYKVKLVAYNPEGCPSKDSTLQIITVQKPVLFQGDTLRFCNKGDTVTLPLLPQGDLTYQWEPPAFLDNPSQNPVRAIQPDSSIWYTATVKTSEGCESQAKFLLRNGILESIAVADTLSGCAPLPVRFSSQSLFAKTERWYFGDGDSSAILVPGQVQNHTYQTAGNYLAILQVRNDTACRALANDTILISVLGGPALADTMLRYCENGSLQLNAPHGLVSTWSWSPGNLLNDSLTQNPIFQVAGPQLFSLQVSDSTGCFSRSKVEVRDGRLKASFSIPNNQLCAPAILQPVNLSTNPGQSRFFWGQDSLTVQGLNPASLSFAIAGRYQIRLKVLSDTACLASADTSLEIVVGGPGIFPEETISFCIKDSVLVQAPQNIGFQYQWPSFAQVSTDSSSAIVFPQDSLSFIVGLKDSLSCSGEKSFQLVPVRPDTSILISSAFDPCTDKLLYNFTSQNMTGNNYSWYINQGTELTGSSVSYIFPTRGNYSLSLISEKGNCVDSIRRQFIINDPPLLLEAMFELKTIYSDCITEPKLRVTNKSLGADRFLWIWDGKSSSEEIPEILISEQDSLKLKLQVYKGICLKEKEMTLAVHRLRPPNLITMQADGLNDEFWIENLPEGTGLEIRDRWGKLIGRFDDYKNDWKPANRGTYFYRLTFSGGDSCNGWLQAVD